MGSFLRILFVVCSIVVVVNVLAIISGPQLRKYAVLTTTSTLGARLLFVVSVGSTGDEGTLPIHFLGSDKLVDASL